MSALSYGKVVLIALALLTSNAFAYQEIEFVREYGAVNQKAKERFLHAPRAVGIFGKRIYIADTDAHRVIVIDADGNTVLTWGVKGDQPGQLKTPAGIAIDELGRVYVADTGNHRIQVFDANGTFIRQFGSKGSGPREFKSPSGIAAQQGFLSVADKGNDRIQILSYDGIFISQVIQKADKDEMKTPVAVAFDVRNNIYALDAENHKVRVFDQSGKQIVQFGSKGKGTEGLYEPQGLALDAYGSIYVADTGNYKLKKFDQKGKLLASIGCKGDSPGQFREAAGVALDRDGRVYVLDSEKQALQVFTGENGDSQPLARVSPPVSIEFAKELPGTVTALAAGRQIWALVQDSIVSLNTATVRTISSRGSDPSFLKKPRAVAADSAGNLWAADAGNDRLQKFSAEGAFLQAIGKSGKGEGEFDTPSGIAISAKGKLFVADTGNKRVVVLNAKGVFLGAFGKGGKAPGQFAEPVDIAVNGTESVFVVDRGNNRISKYDGNGTLIWEKGKAGKQDGEFSEPSNILVTPDGDLYVLDAGNARVQVFDTNGAFLRKFGCEGTAGGQFKTPQGLALEDGVRLFVGDRGNNRVQVFTLHQTPAAPSDIAAQSRANEAQLNWKRNSECYFKFYAVYRSDAATGPFTLVGTTEEPFFTDKGLQSNRAFYYHIRSQAREGNESLASAVVSAVTPRLMPATPKKVRIDTLEKQITLSWLPNLEPFMNHYHVYRAKQPSSGFELIAKLEKTVYVDSKLSDETFYYYQITAVGKEGDESPPCEVVFASTPKASLTQPPLEIAAVELGEIFASSYKYYESHPMGRVSIKNTSDVDIPKIKLTFSIKDFMDFPTEMEIEQLPAKQQTELRLKPVFNNKILEVTENTPLQSEIALTFYFTGESKTITRHFPVTLYERHAMVWDQKAKLGAFVTPKDPPLADFSRAIIRPYVDAYANLHPSLVYARALYDALGVLGLKYIIDPTSPYQGASKNAASVDYLQYPRDTLARKSGDCDDLSILFAAALENIGIETAMVDVPGHVFIMFNTGVAEKEKATLGFPDNLLLSHQGTVWIPVEMTVVGTSFTRAWQKGAEEFAEWSGKGKLDVVHIQKAWEQFKPATLPNTDFRPAMLTRENIDGTFKEELELLGKERLDNLSAVYLERIKKKPGDIDALSRLGVLYAESGLPAEARGQFQKILGLDKNNAAALNDLGNVNLLQDRLDDAKAAYEASLAAEPGDAGVMSNLARVLLRLGKKEDARKLFTEACSADPRVVRRYGDLAADLGMAK